MQVHKFIKPVVTAALLTGAFLVSTPSFAEDAQPAAKHVSARALCKQKFSDRKSKEYKSCIKAARKKK